MTKRVALIPDAKGWAWWHMACAISKYSPNEYKVDVHMKGTFDPSEYDATLEMSWFESGGRNTCKRCCTLVASEGVAYDASVEGNWATDMATKIRNRDKAQEVLPHFDRVLCVSQRLQEQLKWIGIDAVYVPIGVDTKVFQSKGERIEPLTIGFCGQETPGKPGVKGYNRIWKPLIEMMAGEEVSFVANVRSHKDDILTQGEMVDWYNRIHVLACCSVCEGEPVPRLEAMSCGRPVITTSVGDSDTLRRCWDVGTYHDYITAGDIVGRIAWKISTILRKTEVLNVKSPLVRKYAQTRCWSKLSKVWLDAICG